jgi:hypothetical protein
MARATSEPIAAAELEAARGALVGRFPLTVETVQQVAAQVSNAILLGLPADYLQRPHPLPHQFSGPVR